MIIFLKVANFIFTRPYLCLRMRPGKNFRPGYLTRFNSMKYVSIGSDFFCGPLCQISASPKGKVIIEDSVMLGPGVLVLAGNHKINSTALHMRFAGSSEADKGITIETGAWIGANTIILDGVHIGEGAVIGAGSVVINSIPPYCVAAGSPARFLKRRFTQPEMETLLKSTSSRYTISEIDALLNQEKSAT